MDRAGASGMFPVPVWGSGRAGLAGTSSTIPGLEGLWDSCLPLPIFQGLGGIFGNFASLPLCLGSVRVCRSSHEPPLASSLRAAGPCSVISVRYLCVLSPIECETGASGPHPTEAPHCSLSLCLLCWGYCFYLFILKKAVKWILFFLHRLVFPGALQSLSQGVFRVKILHRRSSVPGFPGKAALGLSGLLKSLSVHHYFFMHLFPSLGQEEKS